LLQYEQQLWERGIHLVAGVDEAGRGPLAGPVVASAVVLDRAFALREEHGLLAGLTDSKKLTVARREAFHELLQSLPDVQAGVGLADRDEIDCLNILRATHLAMGRAVRDLGLTPHHVLVDGLPVSGFPCPSTPIVKGDAKSLSIAAASVIAKVVRDARMTELDAVYPQYGFARHKGYGSQFHIRALLEHGPCPEHRRSFRPVREAEEIRRRVQGDLFG
jgi:ribonuclease HII